MQQVENQRISWQWNRPATDALPGPDRNGSVGVGTGFVQLQCIVGRAGQCDESELCGLSCKAGSPADRDRYDRYVALSRKACRVKDGRRLHRCARGVHRMVSGPPCAGADDAAGCAGGFDPGVRGNATPANGRTRHCATQTASLVTRSSAYGRATPSERGSGSCRHRLLRCERALRARARQSGYGVAGGPRLCDVRAGR